MARPSPKWHTTLQVGLRAHFKTHPDVHTFLYTLNEGDAGAVLREIIRAHIQQTQHRAGDPGFQKEVAMRGMSQLLDDTIAAALPAEASPTVASRDGAVMHAPVERPAAATLPLPPATPAATGQPAQATAGFPAVAPQEPPALLTQESPPLPSQESPALPTMRKPGIVSRFDDD